MKNNDIITTPAGIAKFPRLSTPDTKFNPEGVYKCTLVLSLADKGVPEFVERVEAIEAANIAEATETLKKGKKLKTADSLIRPHLDDEGNEVEGKVEITAKMKASGVSKKDNTPWSRKPAVFDSNRKPVKANVGGGSRLKLAVSLIPYESPTVGFGVSCRLEAAQVIELRQFTSNEDASSYGFGDEEGGYSSESSESAESGSADSSGESAPDDAATGGEETAPAPKRVKGEF